MRKKTLPISLQSIEIVGFRGIKNISLTLSTNAQWIILTGENGFGKTSILQAMAAGLLFDKTYIAGGELNVGYKSGKNGIRNTLYNAALKVDGKLKSFHKWSTQSSIARNRNQAIEGFLTAYGSSRLQISGDFSRETLDKQGSAIYSLFNSDAILLNIDQYLINDNAYNPERFRQVIAIFKQLLPRLADIKIELIDKNPQVKYFENDENDQRIPESVTFTQLAAGFKNIIAMIGDMVYRLSSKQNVKSLNDLEGITIIDEIDLHLHPKYQKLFIEKLTEVFPKIQFIASTHSPIPLLGVPPETIVIVVRRTQEEGIKAEKWEEDFSVLTPNAILSSPIFGFQELIPASKSNEKMIRTEDNFAEIETNDQQKTKTNKFLSKENQAELLQLMNET